MRKNLIFLYIFTVFFALNHFTYGMAEDFHSGNIIVLYNLQEDPYVPFAEVMPEPVGGIEAIYKNVEYPALARKAGIEGKVYLLVYINEDGNVDDVKVLKSVAGGCDDAAVKAVRATKYTPGKNGGVPIKVKLSLCINFKMQK